LKRSVKLHVLNLFDELLQQHRHHHALLMESSPSTTSSDLATASLTHLRGRLGESSDQQSVQQDVVALLIASGETPLFGDFYLCSFLIGPLLLIFCSLHSNNRAACVLLQQYMDGWRV
jgi:hypothetical protein